MTPHVSIVMRVSARHTECMACLGAVKSIPPLSLQELMMTYMDNAISESSGIGDNTAHCASISTVRDSPPREQPF